MPQIPLLGEKRTWYSRLQDQLPSLPSLTSAVPPGAVCPSPLQGDTRAHNRWLHGAHLMGSQDVPVFFTQ